MASTQAELEATKMSITIAAFSKQKGAAEKNVAKFIDQAGLSQTLMQGSAFI